MSSLPLLPLSKYPFLSSTSTRELALLCKVIFEQLEYFTAPGKGFAGAGDSCVLYRPDLSEPEIALHCRAGGTPVVGLQDLCRFWESATVRGYSRAIFITNQSYSPSAREFCRDRDLVSVDARDIESGLEDFAPRERLKIFRTYEYQRSGSAASFFTSHIKDLLSVVKGDLI